MKWWVCSHSGVDEDRERFLAAVDGYSWIVIVDMLHIHTIFFTFFGLYLFSRFEILSSFLAFRGQKLANGLECNKNRAHTCERVRL